MSEQPKPCYICKTPPWIRKRPGFVELQCITQEHQFEANGYTEEEAVKRWNRIMSRDVIVTEPQMSLYIVEG